MDSTDNIAFLFGSGAEGNGNFEIPTGNAFKDGTLLNENFEQMKEALGNYFSNEYFHNFDKEGSIRYEKTQINDKLFLEKLLRTNVLDKAAGNINFRDDYLNELIAILNKDEKIELIKSYDPETKSLTNMNVEELNNIIIKIVCNSMQIKTGKNYKRISTKSDSEHRKAIFDNWNKAYSNKVVDEGIIKEFLGNFINYAKDEKHLNEFSEDFKISHELDDLFHTIINPQKYSKSKFMKVFNYYWSCYFFMINNIISSKKENFSGYVDKNDLRFKEILENIVEFSKLLYETNFANEECYYHKLAILFEASVSGVITTNYFNFAEDIFTKKIERLNNGNFAYINGKLSLFEFPEFLEVKDVLDKDTPITQYQNDKLFFPMMFGQSFVKPIVHKIQIDEFTKMRKILAESTILVVLGYNFNSDDNHLNAYIHDFVESGKYLIYVSEDENPGTCNKLKIVYNCDKVIELKVAYKDGNKKTAEKISETVASLNRQS